MYITLVCNHKTLTSVSECYLIWFKFSTSTGVNLMNRFRAYYAIWKLVVLVLVALFIFTDIDKDSLFYSIVISYFFALEHLIYSTIEDNE